MGIPATGRQVAYNGMSVARFEGGKVVDEWTVMDMFALMQQITAPRQVEKPQHRSDN